jgi:hypothetical protein
MLKFQLLPLQVLTYLRSGINSRSPGKGEPGFNSLSLGAYHGGCCAENAEANPALMAEN